MKASTATLITGLILVIVGIYFFGKYTATDKWFSLSGNMIVGGAFVIIVSLLTKMGK